MARTPILRLLGREPDWRSTDLGGSVTVIFQLGNTALAIMAADRAAGRLRGGCIR